MLLLLLLLCNVKCGRARERRCDRMSVKSLMNARTDRLVNNLKSDDSGMVFYLSSTDVYIKYQQKYRHIFVCIGMQKVHIEPRRKSE